MEKDIDTTTLYGGYDISEVNEVADGLFQTIVDLNIPTRLAILGLCRAITVVGNGPDLDNACRMIDIFSEIPYHDTILDDVDEIEWTDEEGDVNER